MAKRNTLPQPAPKLPPPSNMFLPENVNFLATYLLTVCMHVCFVDSTVRSELFSTDDGVVENDSILVLLF